MMYFELCIFCCFFKQKTAYEMRISDWSSDVCSSDLDMRHEVVDRQHGLVAGRNRVGHRQGARRTGQTDVADHAAALAQNCDRRIVDDRRLLYAERERRSEEHTSELQSLMRISYAVFCLKKTKQDADEPTPTPSTNTKSSNTTNNGCTQTTRRKT